MADNTWVQFGIDAASADGREGGRPHDVGWVEDSFTFEESAGRQVATPYTKRHMGTSVTFRRLLILLYAFFLVFFLLLSRVFFLQMVNGNEYRALAEGNRARILPIPAERGIIYDRNGIMLTQNIPNFSLALVPQNLPRDKAEREAVVARLAQLTGQSPEDIRETLKTYGNYSYESIIIDEDLDYETALSIQIAAADLPGIYIHRGAKRLYLHTIGTPEPGVTSTPVLSLAHVLGYQGKLSPGELDELYKKGYLPSDIIGKTGIEKTYETQLRGVYGRRHVEVNALGREQAVLAEEPPSPGSHVLLAIDAKMQQELERIINDTLVKEGKKRAAAIVMDPRNGEILAMISLPAYDNNDFSGGINATKYREYISNEERPLFNRIVSGTYPSGSTIKPAIALAALHSGIITAKTTFLSNGGLRIGQWFFPDWQAGGHGVTDVRKSLAQSVNTFYYYIGGGYGDFVGMGVDTIMKYLQEFHFAEKLGIDIPGEQSGFLPSQDWKQKMSGERWYIGDTYNVSIGQGDILVTPLQIANMTATIANGGTMYRPHVVKQIENTLTKEKNDIKKDIIKADFLDPTHVETVRLGMQDCAVLGSCRRLALLPFTAAGKTGTAQWNSNKPNHAWFTSFAPFEQPEIVVTVLVEEGEEGSRVAAPIAYEFYRWWGKYTGKSR